MRAATPSLSAVPRFWSLPLCPGVAPQLAATSPRHMHALLTVLCSFLARQVMGAACKK